MLALQTKVKRTKNLIITKSAYVPLSATLAVAKMRTKFLDTSQMLLNSLSWEISWKRIKPQYSPKSLLKTTCLIFTQETCSLVQLSSARRSLFFSGYALSTRKNLKSFMAVILLRTPLRRPPTNLSEISLIVWKKAFTAYF